MEYVFSFAVSVPVFMNLLFFLLLFYFWALALGSCHEPAGLSLPVSGYGLTFFVSPGCFLSLK